VFSSTKLEKREEQAQPGSKGVGVIEMEYGKQNRG
jgi:hypothetical protein